jgi:carbonic anhydrase
VENNGHSAKFTFNYPNGKPARLLGGPLKVAYNLDSFHFHWGEIDAAGSEHTLNSRRYSAELHLVTYNSNYGENFFIWL